jgi:superfamily II DNA/RNA helicase
MVNPKVPHIQAVLLVPTRELALQTSQVCRTLGKHLGLEIMVSTGGTGLKDDILRLGETVHLLIGTPGRVLDLSSKGIADLKQCKIFVMDEADKLLSPEFQPVMESLLGMCHPERQVMLFSATFPVLVKDFSVSLIPHDCFDRESSSIEAHRKLLLLIRNRIATCESHTRSTSWRNLRCGVSLNTTRLWKSDRRFIV